MNFKFNNVLPEILNSKFQIPKPSLGNIKRPTMSEIEERLNPKAIQENIVILFMRTTVL